MRVKSRAESDMARALLERQHGSRCVGSAKAAPLGDGAVGASLLTRRADDGRWNDGGAAPGKNGLTGLGQRSAQRVYVIGE